MAGHGLDREIETLMHRLEYEGLPALELLFEVLFPYWKRPINNFRLLARLHFVSDEPILCFVDFWPRGSNEYRTFLDSRGSHPFQQHVERHLPSQAELALWLAEQQHKVIHEIPALPTYLHDWLQCLGVRANRDKLIFESQVWIQQLTCDSSPEDRHHYYQLVFNWTGKDTNLEIRTVAPNVELVSNQTGYSMLVSRINLVEDQQSPSFLIAGFSHIPDRAEIHAIGRQLNLFGVGADRDVLKDPINLEILKRYARRAYPEEFLCDEDLWIEIQSQVEGNLALSPEEEQILQQQAMPLFINGRAGSGKSMMLYYRFAECCDLYINTIRHYDPKEDLGDPRQYRPLLLTYSSSLSEQARKKVHNLLRVNHRNLLEQRMTEAEMASLDPCFSTFHNLLLSYLSDDEKDYFCEDNHISFHRFKHYYLRSYPRPAISAEIVWHTIRTYIKGYELMGSAGGYLDVDDYQREVPQRDRSVSDENFSYVFEDIWPWYQRLCQEHHFWDDQDLVRAALQSEHLQPAYTAIFCDEVQDFTRIELKLILHISIWQHYQLPWTIASLPYAFAGDPMQTINPTGFRWQNLTANFFEQIVCTLNKASHLQQSDPYDLQNNYRSDTSITRFSNIVHLWRRLLFDLTELKPQYPWRPQEPGQPPQYLTISENLTPDDVSSILTGGIIIILPCDEGGELDYIQQDPHLQPLFETFLVESRKPENIQTAASIKGMEFEKVVIYKFGDQYQRHFGKSLPTLLKKQSHNTLELMYFLSKLYVGISRPLKILGILDTREGKSSFWDPACDLDPWLQQLKHLRSDWEPWLGHAQSGGNLNVFTTIDLAQAAQAARQFLRDGWEQKNINKLNDAESYANRAEDEELKRECRAWTLRLHKDFKMAGDIFLQLAKSGSNLQLNNGDPATEAWNCFWQGQHWADLRRWYFHSQCSHEEPSHRPLVRFMAEFAQRARSNDHNIDLIVEQLPAINTWLQDISEAHSQVLTKYHGDPSWQSFISTYLDCVDQVWQALQRETLALDDLLDNLCAKTTSCLLILDKTGNSPRHEHNRCKQLAATGYFKQESYLQAITLWDKIDQKSHSLYYQAKIKTEDYPSKVTWLAKEHQHRTIITAWQEDGKPILGKWPRYLETVASSLMTEKEIDTLLELRIRQRDWSKLWGIPAEDRAAHWKISHDHLCVIEMAADSSLTNWTQMPLEQSQFFESVVKRVFQDQAWKPKLTVFNMGAVLEKQQGSFGSTLEFYEQFIEDPDQQIRIYARQRWLIVKSQQIQRSLVSNDPNVVANGKKNQVSLRRKSREWDMDPSQLDSGIPKVTSSGRLSTAAQAALAGSPNSANGKGQGLDPSLPDKLPLYEQLSILTPEQLQKVEDYIESLKKPKPTVRRTSSRRVSEGKAEK